MYFHTSDFNTNYENLDINQGEFGITNENNIDGWIEDMNKIFKYYTTREANNKIDLIYLYGGGSQLKGIEQYLQKELLIPTFRMNNVHKVVFENELAAKDISIYVNAFASLIRL